jgi:hypothetical protein
MAKVRVKIEGTSVLIKVLPRRGYGGPVFDENPAPGSASWSPRRQLGRPPLDAKAARITELKQNKSWPSVDKLMAAEFPGTKPDVSRSLYRSRKRAGGIRRNRVLEQAFLQLIESMQPRTLRVPKGRGRQRKDAIRFESRQLHRHGYSWAQIAIRLNANYKQKRSADAYRKLCSTPKHQGPWRKLDLNIVRGIKSN